MLWAFVLTPKKIGNIYGRYKISEENPHDLQKLDGFWVDEIFP